MTRILRAPALGLAVIAACAAAMADDGVVAKLLAGSAVERELAAGEVHGYEIEMPAGRFLGVRVEQEGVDVVVRILDPSGAVLRRHDSPIGGFGLESLSFVTSQNGLYRVEVTCFDHLAFPGKYRLRLEGPRMPRKEDPIRVAAEKVLERASNLLDKGNAADFAGAAAAYEESARRFSGIDPRQEATALVGAAESYRRLGRTDQSQKSAERALAAARRAGDRATELHALGAITWSRFLREARPAALEPLEAAIRIDAPPGVRSGQYMNLAYFHWILGDYEAALAENQRTLELARSAGNRLSEAVALKNLAQVYLSLGMPRRALEYADAALEAIRDVPEGLAVRGHILTARGRIWRSLDEPDRSLQDLQAALEVRRRQGDRRSESWTLLEIAANQTDRGETRAARESVEAALALSRAALDVRAQVRELTLLGRIEQTDGNAGAAGQAWDHALALSRSIGDREGESTVRVATARPARDRGELRLAVELAGRALDLDDSLRADVPLPDLRASYGASTEKNRRLLTEILIALDREAPAAGFAEQAFGAAERERARTLREAIAEGGLALGADVPADLRAARSEASGRIAFLQRSLPLAPPSAQSRLFAELTAAEEDFDRVVIGIRARSPRLAALRYPEPLDARQALALLPPGQAIVSYTFAGDGLVAFLLTRSALTLVRLPADAGRLTARVENFVELNARGDSTPGPLADRLSADLVEPVVSALPPGIHRLVIVPVGPLHSLPFEALPGRSGSRSRLVEDFAISYAPSATVLAAVSAAHSRPDEKRADLIAFADPAALATQGQLDKASFRAGGPAEAFAFARMPGALAEANAIARYASNDSKVYTGAEASEARFKREPLDRYRILHLATHGLVSLENPGRSALLLAHSPGDGEDGLLQAREISALDLKSDIVLLSGCETARGTVLAGEGVQSLARAFFLAGARSVVASLWKVRDQATEEFMTSFYRRLAEGQPKDAALRAAKLELAGNPRTASPRDWAAFVLIGDGSGRIALTARR